MDEPAISIYTVPMQQIATKDSTGLEASHTPDAQLGYIEREPLHAYAVTIAGKKHSCTFFTQTAHESRQCVERLNEAMSNKTSVVMKPDATVNRVKRTG